MISGLLTSSAATLAMAASLFGRRSLDGWLGELDDIRDGALASPEGCLASAMGDVAPLDDQASPLASLEAPLPAAAAGPPDPDPDPDAGLVDRPLVAVQPSPHRARPGEMWHPQIVMAPASAVEERIDRNELDDDAEAGAVDVAADSIIAADGGPLGIVATPFVRHRPVARRLDVAPDGTVAVDEGIVRLADPVDVVVEQHPDGLALTLDAGWCWADRTDGATPLTISVPAGALTVPTGTAALVVIEADHASFAVVVEGEAVLRHVGGRLRLRAGAMTLAPVVGEPQVDVATEAEILADPLLQHNLRLDGVR